MQEQDKKQQHKNHALDTYSW